MLQSLRPLPVLALVLLGGCANLMPPTQVTAPVAPAWQAPLPHQGSVVALTDWWQAQGDPLLVELITAAQAVSPSVAQSLARIEAARANQALARSALLPNLGAQASASRGVSQPNTTVATTSQLGLQAAWELDLVGANRAVSNAALANLQGTQAQWHDARVSVAAEVANLYHGLTTCGRLLALAEIERLLTLNPDSVVVIDEAYVDFGGESAVGLIGQYPQLLVVRTFSKSRSLAGLRVGYAMGDPGLIEALERVKNSFNSYPLDRLAIAAAVASVRDPDWFERSCALVVRERETMRERLQARGFEVLPSCANFLFARHPQHEGAALQAGLRERRILVRHFKAPRLDPFLRISVGTEAQGLALDDALAQILA